MAVQPLRYCFQKSIAATVEIEVKIGEVGILELSVEVLVVVFRVSIDYNLLLVVFCWLQLQSDSIDRCLKAKLLIHYIESGCVHDCFDVLSVSDAQFVHSGMKGPGLDQRDLEPLTKMLCVFWLLVYLQV